MQSPTPQVTLPAHVKMNIAAHQEKEKMGKREEEKEERKQSTDFGEAACYPFAVVYRAARQKNDLYEGSG